MGTLNHCIFTGRLTANPEMKMVSFGGKQSETCSFSLGIDLGFGEKKRTIFPWFQAWRQDAVFLAKYGQKGQEVTVVSQYDMRADKTDEKKNYHSFVVRELQLHRGFKSEEGNSGTSPAPPPIKTTPSNTSPSVAPSNMSPLYDAMCGDEDENDLPF